MKVQSFAFNPFSENTYILYDQTKECIIIDAGCYTEAEQNVLTSFIETNELVPKAIVHTHSHIDHVLGCAFVKNKYKIPLHIHKEDETTLNSVVNYASLYGFPNYKPQKQDFFLKEGDFFKFGESELKIIFVPGHAPGHIALYSEKFNFVINGDVLFQRGIGRTDLPGGDHNTLLKSIRTKLFTLPENTRVYCGHGPTTTIKEEIKSNPFLN